MQLSQVAPSDGPDVVSAAASQAPPTPTRERQADAVVVPIDLGDLKVQNR